MDTLAGGDHGLVGASCILVTQAALVSDGVAGDVGSDVGNAQGDGQRQSGVGGIAVGGVAEREPKLVATGGLRRGDVHRRVRRRAVDAAQVVDGRDIGRAARQGGRNQADIAAAGSDLIGQDDGVGGARRQAEIDRVGDGLADGDGRIAVLAGVAAVGEVLRRGYDGLGGYAGCRHRDVGRCVLGQCGGCRSIGIIRRQGLGGKCGGVLVGRAGDDIGLELDAEGGRLRRGLAGRGGVRTRVADGIADEAIGVAARCRDRVHGRRVESRCRQRIGHHALVGVEGRRCRVGVTPGQGDRDAVATDAAIRRQVLARCEVGVGRPVEHLQVGGRVQIVRTVAGGEVAGVDGIGVGRRRRRGDGDVDRAAAGGQGGAARVGDGSASGVRGDGTGTGPLDVRQGSNDQVGGQMVDQVGRQGRVGGIAVTQRQGQRRGAVLRHDGR